MPNKLSISVWAALITLTGVGQTASAQRVQVAYAGSMTAVMNRGLGPAIRRDLRLRLEGRAQGAYGLAHFITSGAIRPDLFICITPGPMRIVLRAGFARRARPIARTQLVIAYSAHSRFAKLFQAGKTAWWRILEKPGLRLGRTNPETDPQGRNFLLMLRAAGQKLGQPQFADTIAGPTLNRRQIYPEAEVMARLQAGQLDAAAAYQCQPVALGLPYIHLPWPLNLGPGSHRALAHMRLRLQGKSYRPGRLVFYAAVLTRAPHPRRARRLLHWLLRPMAQSILHHYGYDAAAGARSLP